VQNWHIDYWALDEVGAFSILVQALEIVDALSLVSSMDVLNYYFREVWKAYRMNPYHNAHHALYTTHYAFKFLTAANLDEADILDDIPIFALLIGSFCHDIDHRGRSQQFEILTRSELALRYNDLSPLENHHCARAFEIAMSGGATAKGNIFADFSSEAYAAVREMMVAGILGTDMRHHGRHVTLIQEYEAERKAVEDDAWSWKGEHKQFLVEFLVHAADISNPMHPRPIAEKWNDLMSTEFLAQADDEERLGLPVTALMQSYRDPVGAAKSFVGFIDFVLQPMFLPMFRTFDGLDEPRANLASIREVTNKKYTDTLKESEDKARRERGEKIASAKSRLKSIHRLGMLRARVVQPQSSSSALGLPITSTKSGASTKSGKKEGVMKKESSKGSARSKTAKQGQQA